MVSTITLRFLTVDDETKSLIINGGNSPVLDLTLKGSKTWEKVLQHLEKKWICLSNQLRQKLVFYYYDHSGDPSYKVPIALATFPMIDILNNHPRLIEYLDPSSVVKLSKSVIPIVEIFYVLSHRPYSHIKYTDFMKLINSNPSSVPTSSHNLNLTDYKFVANATGTESSTLNSQYALQQLQQQQNLSQQFNYPQTSNINTNYYNSIQNKNERYASIYTPNTSININTIPLPPSCYYPVNGLNSSSLTSTTNNYSSFAQIQPQSYMTQSFIPNTSTQQISLQNIQSFNQISNQLPSEQINNHHPINQETNNLDNNTTNNNANSTNTDTNTNNYNFNYDDQLPSLEPFSSLSTQNTPIKEINTNAPYSSYDITSSHNYSVNDQTFSKIESKENVNIHHLPTDSNNQQINNMITTETAITTTVTNHHPHSNRISMFSPSRLLNRHGVTGRDTDVHKSSQSNNNSSSSSTNNNSLLLSPFKSGNSNNNSLKDINDDNGNSNLVFSSLSNFLTDKSFPVPFMSPRKSTTTNTKINNNSTNLSQIVNQLKGPQDDLKNVLKPIENGQNNNNSSSSSSAIANETKQQLNFFMEEDSLLQAMNAIEGIHDSVLSYPTDHQSNPNTTTTTTTITTTTTTATDSSIIVTSTTTTTITTTGTTATVMNNTNDNVSDNKINQINSNNEYNITETDNNKKTKKAKVNKIISKNNINSLVNGVTNIDNHPNTNEDNPILSIQPENISNKSNNKNKFKTKKQDNDITTVTTSKKLKSTHTTTSNKIINKTESLKPKTISNTNLPNIGMSLGLHSEFSNLPSSNASNMISTGNLKHLQSSTQSSNYLHTTFTNDNTMQISMDGYSLLGLSIDNITNNHLYFNHNIDTSGNGICHDDSTCMLSRLSFFPLSYCEVDQLSDDGEVEVEVEGNTKNKNNIRLIDTIINDTKLPTSLISTAVTSTTITTTTSTTTTVMNINENQQTDNNENSNDYPNIFFGLDFEFSKSDYETAQSLNNLIGSENVGSDKMNEPLNNNCNEKETKIITELTTENNKNLKNNTIVNDNNNIISNTNNGGNKNDQLLDCSSRDKFSRNSKHSLLTTKSGNTSSTRLFEHIEKIDKVQNNINNTNDVNIVSLTSKVLDTTNTDNLHESHVPVLNATDTFPLINGVKSSFTTTEFPLPINTHIHDSDASGLGGYAASASNNDSTYHGHFPDNDDNNKQTRDFIISNITSHGLPPVKLSSFNEIPKQMNKLKSVITEVQGNFVEKSVRGDQDPTGTAGTITTTGSSVTTSISSAQSHGVHIPVILDDTVPVKTTFSYTPTSGFVITSFQSNAYPIIRPKILTYSSSADTTLPNRFILHNNNLKCQQNTSIYSINHNSNDIDDSSHGLKKLVKNTNVTSITPEITSTLPTVTFIDTENNKNIILETNNILVTDNSNNKINIGCNISKKRRFRITPTFLGPLELRHLFIPNGLNNLQGSSNNSSSSAFHFQ